MRDEKDRLEREKYLRENDENYDETDVNGGRYEGKQENKDEGDTHNEVPH